MTQPTLRLVESSRVICQIIDLWLSDMKRMEREKRRLQALHEDQTTIAQLAALLANGVAIGPGEAFPDGWEDSTRGRARRYTQAREEHLAAARSLLGWDGT